MNIIFEGGDCTGKTTLIKELSKLVNWSDIRHSIAPLNENDGLIQNINILHSLWTTENIIYDRAFIGECVYGPMFRDYYPDYMKNIINLVPSNTYFILVKADLETVKKRFDGKGIRIDQLEEAMQRFDIEMHKYIPKSRLFIIDTTNRSPQQCINEIMEWILDG